MCAEGKAFSDDSKLSSLVRRIIREEERDRRLTAISQLRDFLLISDNNHVRLCNIQLLLAYCYLLQCYWVNNYLIGFVCKKSYTGSCFLMLQDFDGKLVLHIFRFLLKHFSYWQCMLQNFLFRHRKILFYSHIYIRRHSQ